MPCAGHGPSLQHGMPFCISYCRKEAKTSTWKYADGHKKKTATTQQPWRHFYCVFTGPAPQPAHREPGGGGLAQIHVGLKVEFVLARPVTQAGMVAELLKRHILRYGIGSFETYLDLTHAIV